MSTPSLQRFAVLLPIVVAVVGGAIGYSQTGWGPPTHPPLALSETPLLPSRPFVNGAPPPPKTFLVAAQTPHMIATPPAGDAGAPGAGR